MRSELCFLEISSALAYLHVTLLRIANRGRGEDKVFVPHTQKFYWLVYSSNKGMQFNLNFRGNSQRSEKGILLQHSTGPSSLSSHLEGRLPFLPSQTSKTDLCIRDNWFRSDLHDVKRVTEISWWWISIVCMWSTPGLDEIKIPDGLNHQETLPPSKCSFLSGNLEAGELHSVFCSLIFILKCKHRLWLLMVTPLSTDI